MQSYCEIYNILFIIMAVLNKSQDRVILASFSIVWVTTAYYRVDLSPMPSIHVDTAELAKYLALTDVDRRHDPLAAAQISWG